jgi:hypothetical protein
LGRRHFIPRKLFQEILWLNYGHSGAVARARLSLVESFGATHGSFASNRHAPNPAESGNHPRRFGIYFLGVGLNEGCPLRPAGLTPNNNAEV